MGTSTPSTGSPGTADLTLGEAVEPLRAAGHPDLADRIERELVARDDLVGGRRHLFEAEMKEDRREQGARRREAVPDGNGHGAAERRFDDPPKGTR